MYYEYSFQTVEMKSTFPDEGDSSVSNVRKFAGLKVFKESLFQLSQDRCTARLVLKCYNYTGRVVGKLLQRFRIAITDDSICPSRLLDGRLSNCGLERGDLSDTVHLSPVVP